MRILVLTKNIHHELVLQRELQILNHEVFVTRNERSICLVNECELVFDCLFLSETLSEKEFLSITKKAFSLFNGQIIRVIPENGEYPSHSKEASNVLNVSRSFVDLRDLLATLITKNDEYKEQVSLEQFIRKLSNNEQLLFEQLQEERPITREQLCQIIWQGDESKSRKSQLSYIAKKINTKLDASNYTDKRIKTYWGKGYILQ